jgi:hypothetical protein
MPTASFLVETYQKKTKCDKLIHLGSQPAQITTSHESPLAFAQMLVKLLNKGYHRCANIVGMVMSQVVWCMRTWAINTENVTFSEFFMFFLFCPAS